jgi:hypothetical protein
MQSAFCGLNQSVSVHDLQVRLQGSKEEATPGTEERRNGIE